MTMSVLSVKPWTMMALACFAAKMVVVLNEVVNVDAESILQLLIQFGHVNESMDDLETAPLRGNLCEV